MQTIHASYDYRFGGGAAFIYVRNVFKMAVVWLLAVLMTLCEAGGTYVISYVMLLSILSKDRVVQKDKPVGVLPTKSTYTPEITKTMT